MDMPVSNVIRSDGNPGNIHVTVVSQRTGFRYI